MCAGQCVLATSFSFYLSGVSIYLSAAECHKLACPSVIWNLPCMHDTHSAGASQCPGQSIVHPTSGLPLQCHVSEHCMSATCRVNTTSPPSSSPAFADMVTLQLKLCSTPTQVAISGSLQGSGIVFPEIQVGGPTRVQINQGAGQLEITGWTVTNNTLHFSTKVSL